MCVCVCVIMTFWVEVVRCAITIRLFANHTILSILYNELLVLATLEKVYGRNAFPNNQLSQSLSPFFSMHAFRLQECRACARLHAHIRPKIFVLYNVRGLVGHYFQTCDQKNRNFLPSSRMNAFHKPQFFVLPIDLNFRMPGSTKPERILSVWDKGYFEFSAFTTL